MKRLTALVTLCLAPFCGCSPRDVILGVQTPDAAKPFDAGGSDSGAALDEFRPGAGNAPIVCAPQLPGCNVDVSAFFLHANLGADRLISGAFDATGSLVVTGEVASPEPGRRSDAFLAALGKDAAPAYWVLADWRNENWRDRGVAVFPQPDGTVLTAGHHAVNGHIFYPWLDLVSPTTGSALALTSPFAVACAEPPCAEAEGQELLAVRQLPGGDFVMAGTYTDEPVTRRPWLQGEYARKDVGLVLRLSPGQTPKWGRVMGDLAIDAALDVGVLPGGDLLVVARDSVRGSTLRPLGQDLILLRMDANSGAATIVQRVSTTRLVRAARVVVHADGSSHVVVSFEGALDLIAQVHVADGGAAVVLVGLDAAFNLSWSTRLGTTRTPEAFALAAAGGRILVAADVTLPRGSSLQKLAKTNDATLLFGFEPSGAPRFGVVLNSGDAAEVNAIVMNSRAEIFLLGGFSGVFGLPERRFATVTPDDLVEHRWDIFVLKVAAPL